MENIQRKSEFPWQFNFPESNIQPKEFEPKWGHRYSEGGESVSLEEVFQFWGVSYRRVEFS